MLTGVDISESSPGVFPALLFTTRGLNTSSARLLVLVVCLSRYWRSTRNIREEVAHEMLYPRAASDRFQLRDVYNIAITDDSINK